MAVVRYHAQQPVLSYCEFASASNAERPQVLARLLAQEGLAGMRVSTLLDVGEFDLQLIEAPDVTAEELRAAVRWRIKDRLDYALDEAVLDVFPIPGQQERGRPPMVYVVAARQAQVKRYIDLLENAGADLCCVDIPELAQRNLAVRLNEDARGVAMLSLGPDAGLLTLTCDGVLYLAREIDVGYRALESAAPPPEGKAGGLQLAENLLPDQRRALETLVLEVQRSLDYFESHFGLAPIGHLVIAPTPMPVPAMLDYMGENLGVAVRQLELADIVDVEQTTDRSLQAECLLAIGAALRGVEA
ncbi:MSHA biogenesis protein MshI [Thiohalophilus thiocyanatoxydans]|uniref:MSHA biogenesis protein MshI n=1 Tax=Thiohalophilus thiocyanatoxydans TaxID=381308 RepID=A0A4R8IX21_9GAMM|nr:MSHA biogenesis protein MshI [Thiohalophilus thiocyanatoxydans]